MILQLRLGEAANCVHGRDQKIEPDVIREMNAAFQNQDGFERHCVNVTGLSMEEVESAFAPVLPECRLPVKREIDRRASSQSLS